MWSKYKWILSSLLQAIYYRPAFAHCLRHRQLGGSPDDSCQTKPRVAQLEVILIKFQFGNYYRDKEDGISPMMAAVGAGRLEVVRHLVVQHFDGFLSIICQRLEGLFFLFENIGRNMINFITDGFSWDRYANHWQPRSNSDRCGEVLLSFFQLKFYIYSESG